MATVYYYDDGTNRHYSNIEKSGYTAWDPSSTSPGTGGISKRFAILDEGSLILQEDSTCMFASILNEEFDFSVIDASECVNMTSLFESSEVTVIDISMWNTSNVTNMLLMFAGCHAKEIIVNGIDTSKVTDMSNMFGNLHGCAYLDVHELDTSNVTNMEAMFYSRVNPSLIAIDIRSPFSVLNCRNARAMFQNEPLLKYIYVDPGVNWTWGKYSKYLVAASTEYMFSGCYSLPNYISSSSNDIMKASTNDYFTASTRDMPKSHVVYEKVNGAWVEVEVMIKNADSWKSGEIYM